MFINMFAEKTVIDQLCAQPLTGLIGSEVKALYKQFDLDQYSFVNFIFQLLIKKPTINQYKE